MRYNGKRYLRVEGAEVHPSSCFADEATPSTDSWETAASIQALQAINAFVFIARNNFPDEQMCFWTGGVVRESSCRQRNAFGWDREELLVGKTTPARRNPEEIFSRCP